MWLALVAFGDGRLGLVGAPEGVDEAGALALAEAAAREIPDARAIPPCRESDLPGHLDACRFRGGRVVLDEPAAATLQADTLRARRAPLLAEADWRLAKAQDAGDVALGCRIRAYRARLRDWPTVGGPAPAPPWGPSTAASDTPLALSGEHGL